MNLPADPKFRLRSSLTRNGTRLAIINSALLADTNIKKVPCTFGVSRVALPDRIRGLNRRLAAFRTGCAKWSGTTHLPASQI